MSKVEDVARAIARRLAKREHGESYEGYESSHWEAAQDLARAAIAAMRIPTEPMLADGYEAEASKRLLSAAWNAMVDSALKE